MSVKDPVPSKPPVSVMPLERIGLNEIIQQHFLMQKEKRNYSRFLFAIVNEFSLDEFKQYTNFPELMQHAIAVKSVSAPPKMSLERYIKANFKNNVPDEKKWRGGGFANLKLTNGFYESATAARLFEKIYGIKKCQVILSHLGDDENQPNHADSSDSDFEVWQELGPEDEQLVANIDLTKNNQPFVCNINLRKKYPRKRKTLPSASGIATYNFTRKFVEQMPSSFSMEGSNDEIVLLSCDTAFETVDPPNVTHEQDKRIEVISDIMLVPPTPFRDKAIQRQPDLRVTSHPRALKPINCTQVLGERKIGPKSKFVRTSRIVYIDEDSDEQPPTTKTVNENPPNLGNSKPKIGPKSKMILSKNAAMGPPLKTTQEVLQDLMYTNPSQMLATNQQEHLQESSDSVAVSKPKPRIGPKSIMDSMKNSNVHPSLLSPENQLNQMMHTSTPINESLNKMVPKAKIGPKSMMRNVDSSLSTQELLQVLSHDDSSTVQANKSYAREANKGVSTELSQNLSLEHVPKSKGVFGPTSPVNFTGSLQSHSSSKALPSISTIVNLQNSDPERTVRNTNSSLTQLPCLLCLTKTSPILFEDDENNQNNPTSEPSKQCSQSSALISNFMQSFDALSQRAKEHLPKYIAETQPNALSLKHFWYEFLRSEFENDSSAAETQLNNGNDNADDVQMEIQSQVVLRPEQIEAEPQSQAVLRPEQIEAEQAVLHPAHLGLKRQSQDQIEAKSQSQVVLHSDQAESEVQSQIVLHPDRVEAEPQSEAVLHPERLEAEPQSKAVSQPDQVETEARSQVVFNSEQLEVGPQTQAALHPQPAGAQSQNVSPSEQIEAEVHFRVVSNPEQIQTEPQSQTILHSDQVEAEVQFQAVLNHDQQEAEPISQIILTPDQLKAEPESEDLVNRVTVDPLTLIVEVKVEKVYDECNNDSYSSDVQIIEVPPSEPIEILADDTQELLDGLQVDGNNSEEQTTFRPFAIPQQPIASCSKAIPPAANKMKGFLTSLPKIPAKKRIYPPLEIVVEAAQKIPPTDLPMHDFSQQPDSPPSNENYEIEEFTMTDSQHQRYELLNNENTIFLSSQLENYAFTTGKSNDPKSTVIQNNQPQLATLKRLSADALICQPNKRRRSNETIKRELNWKIMDIRSMIFKPLANNIFHLELQLRNNFDTFHVQDQQSIKRLLHLSDKEWQHVVKVLTALNGYRYDFSTTAVASPKLDLPSRIMNLFVKSIPMFVRSNIQFKDFMGHCLTVSEQQPLVDKNIDAAIDPKILKKMEEFRKSLSKKRD